MLLKHVNNTEVAIEILKSFYVKEKQIFKLKVRWHNIGKCHAPWSMEIVQTIKVKKEDMANWQPYEYSKPT